MLLTSSAWAQVGVIPGPDPAAARVEGLLPFAGFAYRRVAPAAVTPEALAGLRTVVLLRAPLSAEAVAALAQFAAGGGKLVLVAQEEAPDLYRAVGVEGAPAQPPRRWERIARAGGTSAAPGLPETVRDAAAPPVSLTPLPGTTVLARRVAGDPAPGTPPGPAAVTLAPGGAALDGLFAPGDRWEKSWLLAAVLAAVDPALTETAARGLRRQGADALQAAAGHWARRRDDARLDANARQDRLRRLQALRAEWSRLGRGEATMAGAAALQRFIRRARELDMGLAPSAPDELRGIWIHTYAPTDWERVAKRVKAAGLNALFVRVGRGGNLIYPSPLLPRDAWAEKAGGDELKRAVDAAHRHGLQFHAWRVNFHMGSAPKEYRDRMAAEDRLVRDSQGRQADFANPADPRNQELEFQVMRELVQKYDIDGLQFDYIRYPDAPSYDYDYGPVSRREFERRRGQPVFVWPADVLYGPLKTAYEAWERENVNRLVERVYREVKRLKPAVQVSAAVWRNHRRYWAIIKQDWPLWVERGWLDFVVPMDYTPEMETFAATVDAQVSLTRGRMPLAAGIGNWLLQTPEELVRQVEITREAGAAGFVLFAYNAEQIEEQLAGLRLGATATDARVPLPAPEVRITLVSNHMAPKDAPLAIMARAPLRLEVVPTRREPAAPGSPALRSPSVPPPGGLSEFEAPAWQLRLERPTGELIQALRLIHPGQPTVWQGWSPGGRFQPVIRRVKGGLESTNTLLARGPLIEGLTDPEIVRLRAQERPPVFPPSPAGPRVGVYMGGLGAETTLAALQRQPGLRVAPIHHLRADHLAAVDVLLLSQLADLAELDAATQARLRKWVESGGRLILSHDAVGARWHPRLFPQVVQNVELVPATPLVTAEALGSIAASSRLRHAGGDQFRLTPGPAGRVLAREVPASSDGPGAPVIVTGKVGRGTVALVGFLSGYLQTELGADEARLLSALAAGGGG